MTETYSNPQETTANDIHHTAVAMAATTKPDLTANIIREQDGKSIWDAFYTASHIKKGYSKGEDIHGRTIIVETLAAKLEREGKQPSGKNQPELYVYVETIENGEKVWNSLAVAWNGKKAGVFTGKTTDGESLVMQTKEAIEALSVKRQPKAIKAIDLDS